MFATTDDLAARLGVTLTSAQESQAWAALEASTATIAAELDVNSDDVDPVPDLIRHVAITLALRMYSNPTDLQSERLGDYQSAFRNTELTQTERLLVRNAWHGRVSGSARMVGTIDEVYDNTFDE